MSGVKLHNGQPQLAARGHLDPCLILYNQACHRESMAIASDQLAPVLANLDYPQLLLRPRFPEQVLVVVEQLFDRCREL